MKLPYFEYEYHLEDIREYNKEREKEDERQRKEQDKMHRTMKNPMQGFGGYKMPNMNNLSQQMPKFSPPNFKL